MTNQQLIEYFANVKFTDPIPTDGFHKAQQAARLLQIAEPHQHDKIGDSIMAIRDAARGYCDVQHDGRWALGPRGRAMLSFQ